jgi:hypothetical protein
VRVGTAFLTGWLVGIVAIVLAGEVDSRFAVLFFVTGVLLLYAATVGLTNDREWAAVPALPRSNGVRTAVCVLTFMIGTGWCFGGLGGLLLLLGIA